MGRRVYADNILWVCCCCGFLPVVAIIKTCIIAVPVLILNVIPITFISIILLPHDIFLTYYTLYKT